MEQKLFEGSLSVINLGLPNFFDDLKQQGAACVHVDWTPPAGGDVRLIEILDRLEELG